MAAADTTLTEGGAATQESEAAKIAATRVEYIKTRSEAFEKEEENKVEPAAEIMSIEDGQVLI